MNEAPNKWMIALTVMLPTLMVIVDSSVVNVALSHIRGSLSAGIDESTWSITSYLAANAVVIPLTGWLSRLVGRKRYLILSIILFTMSSLFCGMAWNIESLVFFRVLQGLAGGSLQPISQSVLLESFPRSQHGIAMAIFGGGVMFGPIIGPLLGGWITDNWSWHWIFFVNVPIGIVCVLLTLMFVFDPPYMKRMKMKIDYPGLITLAFWVGALQMILDRGQGKDWFSSGFIVSLAVVSFVAFGLFLILEYYGETPVVDLHVLKNPSFAIGTAVMFFVMMNLFGSIVLLPVYVQNLMGYTAFLAGLVLAPGGISSLIAMPVAGILVSRMNPKLIAATGILLVSYSTYLMSRFTLDADFYSILWPRVVMGVGMGFTFIPLTTLTLSHLPREMMTNATSIYNLVRNIGGSFGVAIAATILTRRAQFHQARMTEHLTPFDFSYLSEEGEISRILDVQGAGSWFAGEGGGGVIYEQLLRQSSMFSFNDVFFSLSVALVLMVPLVFLMKHGDHGDEPAIPPAE
ncbi:MAG TPA: DHA2 family efflux MFS transporter permease subunit [Syntrophales bacterium]|nr:DHA2 family efflux MFS transporter permease subunit [Syntrophales bacterium]HQB30031.1 DHA2 family efflux MFS transporter permease subunit [Syntrophales bacterium]HQN79026.1 DHA2 family efflux MFS transporter permease subunit [Syntrophales bacterium]HQQ28009.1 DHA2 family efflux MFS transporter permease subunit [Syntrophales bacterium]